MKLARPPLTPLKALAVPIGINYTSTKFFFLHFMIVWYFFKLIIDCAFCELQKSCVLNHYFSRCSIGIIMHILQTMLDSDVAFTHEVLSLDN